MQAWLRSAPQPLSDAQQQAFLDSLAMVRERGCSITVRAHRDPEFEEWPSSDPTSVWPIPDASVIASTHSLELPPRRTRGWFGRCSRLSAAVLDYGDDPVCVIGVAPLPFGMRRDQIFEAARHVTDARGLGQPQLSRAVLALIRVNLRVQVLLATARTGDRRRGQRAVPVTDAVNDASVLQRFRLAGQRARRSDRGTRPAR